jgi:hypothetical protein
MRVLDEIGNASELSNEISRTFPSPVQLTFGTDFRITMSSPHWPPDGSAIAFSYLQLQTNVGNVWRMQIR